MTRGICLSVFVAFATVGGASKAMAADEIGAAAFDNPTKVSFDGLGFGESITDQFAGVDFGGSMFGSAPDAAAGPVAAAQPAGAATRVPTPRFPPSTVVPRRSMRCLPHWR